MEMQQFLFFALDIFQFYAIIDSNLNISFLN